MANATATPVLLSLDEVASVLRVTRPTVLRLVSQGRLPRPSCSVGIQRRWRASDIAEFAGLR